MFPRRSPARFALNAIDPRLLVLSVRDPGRRQQIPKDGLSPITAV